VRESFNNSVSVHLQTIPQALEDGMVIKLSWQLEDRESEANFLKLLHERHVSSVPELVACEDLTEMQDEMHGDIQEILRTPLPRTTDNRIYRAIVLKPYLVPLIEIPDFEVFYSLFKRLVDGELRKLEEIPKANIIAYLSVHYDVYRRGKVLHRDINPQNLMIKCEKSGTYSPFLIDFDFAIQSDQNGLNRIRTHRTMSTPFLAGELLTENAIPARYRHDLEAFSWTF